MAKTFSRRSVLFGMIIYAMSACLPMIAAAKEVKDMTGRVVTTPDTIRSVYAASPPETMLVYAIDPTLLAGLNFPLRGCDKYIDAHTVNLPVIGGYFGQGKTPNLEKLVALNPDIVIGRESNPINRKFELFLKKFNIPVASVIVDELDQYPEAFEVAGKILNRKSRAKVLADYTRNCLSQVHQETATIPAHEKVKVYYAEGNDGLYTENSTSIHAELINLAGGANVHKGEGSTRYGREKVTIEKVISYTPEVIFVEQPLFYKKIFTSAGWKSIPAVQNNQVYLIPKKPFNWFDRPPSFMRILGLKWVASTLYPDRFDWDMQEETREFFRVFLQKEISPKDARQLLSAAE